MNAPDHRPSARLAPLLAQLTTSLDLALERMDGLTDEEFWWRPEPDAATAARTPKGRLRPAPLPDDSPRTRTIVLLTGHLGEGALLRADYTTGTHALTPKDITWPATADEAAPFLRHAFTHWHDALASLPDADLDVIGRSAYPWGLDRRLPVLDIAWWVTRELIHHTAEIAFIRDLYARRQVRGGR
jgi:hypothetical protein